MSALEELRAKVEEVRREHRVFRRRIWAGGRWADSIDYCSRCMAEWPCDAIAGWQAALKLAEVAG